MCRKCGKRFDLIDLYICGGSGVVTICWMCWRKDEIRRESAEEVLRDING